jgi:hypothetical protein
MTTDSHTRITLTIVWIVAILAALMIGGAVALAWANRPSPDWMATAGTGSLMGLLTYLTPRAPSAPPQVPPVTTTGPSDPPDTAKES